MNIRTNIRHVILISIITTLSIFSLAGCQSKLDIAGKHHKTVTEKWFELARYAESKISKHGVIITAKLKHGDLMNKTKFVLSDIQLALVTSHFNINLLAPDFEDKYICSPVCLQLIEYSPYLKATDETLLTEYFNNHEFELFKFYGDLVILDKELTTLKNSNPSLFEKYIKWMVSNKTSFDNLAEFSEYLNKAFSRTAMANFNNFADDFAPNTNPLLLNDPQKIWQQQDFQSPDKEWLSADKANDNIVITENDSSKVNATTILDGIEINPIADYNAVESLRVKNELTKVNLEIGSQLCTYANNYFGNLKEISGLQYAINVRGQAKLEVDGAILEAPSGILFSSNIQVSFLPMSELKSFNRNDIAPCKLSID